MPVPPRRLAGRSPMLPLLCATALLFAACASTATGGSNELTIEARESGTETTTTTTEPGSDTEPAAEGTATTATTSTPTGDASDVPGTTTTEPPVLPPTASVAPDWLGTRVLPTLPGGAVVPQTTPAELLDRRLISVDSLPPPPQDTFQSSVGPLEGEPLARSTWNDGCPVGVEDLAYVTVSFWGFDDEAHQGELIVHVGVADDIVTVFERLYEARFPIEEMRIVTPADLDAPPIGDGNNTSSFVCRAVTGGSRFSEHASGLAIDVNPFHNPYVKGNLVLPELATSYEDRARVLPGMILEGDAAVAAFDDIGWGWGGRWSSLKDYQHFALNDR